MKRFCLSLLIVLLFAGTATAQYTITSANFRTFPCALLSNTVTVSGYTAGLSVKFVYGDGTSDTALANNVNPQNHTYTWPGTYTVKIYLFLGAVVMDSSVYSVSMANCNELHFVGFIDTNSNCILDSHEHEIPIPATLEVDSAGIAIDTITWISDYEYYVHGPAGTIYSFRLLSPPTGFVLECPASGVIFDTALGTVAINANKSFAFQCSSSIAFDIGEFVSTRAGRHEYSADIYVSNSSCLPQADTLRMTFSTKYTDFGAYPVPLSIVGNVATWVFPVITAVTPQLVHVNSFTSSGYLSVGDTSHNSFALSLTPGDTNPANNTITTIDTAKASYDPNEKSVYPQGNITAGTKLQYTIAFENTGNDTAHNIYIMDTLSNNLDTKSLSTIAASANVTTIPQKIGSLNIIKFDFPGINLLDSSHHGQCDGMVVFTINTKADLFDGTTIFNHAGIFFDDNPVVMTDTVENIIGIPERVANMSNVSKIQLYPNPVTDELTILVDNGSCSKLTITNIMGQVVVDQNFSGTKTMINVKALPTGVYYITLKGDSGVKVRKFEKM